MIASISTWMNTKQIPIKIIQLVTVLGYLVEVLVSSTSCHSYLRWLSWGIFFLTSRQTVMELYELWTNLRTHIEVNLSCVLWLLEAQLVQISGNAKTMRSVTTSRVLVLLYTEELQLQPSKWLHQLTQNCSAAWLPLIYQIELNRISSMAVADGSCAEANYPKLQQWRLICPRNLLLYYEKYANTRICLKHMLV